MADPGTPKASSSHSEAASPSAKRALDYDFFSERKKKLPKIVEEDLQDLKIHNLAISKRFNGKVTLRCLAVCDLPKVVKLACDDGEQKTTVTAFGKAAQILRSSLKAMDIFSLANFEVRAENCDYPSGAYQNLEIIFSEWATFKAIQDNLFTSIPYQWTSVGESKALPDSSVVDVLVVVAKNWGVTSTSTGKSKIDVSLTDKSMETIRLTLWEANADQLVGIEGEVIAISRASVATYLDFKVLSAKWHTTIEVRPGTEEANDLLEWFNKAIDN